MANINVGILNETSALATVEALVTARENGKHFVSTADHPFLVNFFNRLDGWKYRKLIRDTENVKEVIGFDIRTDLEGRVVRKEEVARYVTKYYFDADAVDGIIRDLKQDCNREILVKELNRITTLLSL